MTKSVLITGATLGLGGMAMDTGGTIPEIVANEHVAENVVGGTKTIGGVLARNASRNLSSVRSNLGPASK